MRLVADCWRAHEPRWSSLPLSGAGASLNGGRFDPIGTPALYLSSRFEGAVAEAGQGFPIKIESLTICVYEVDCEDMVDLRSEADLVREGFVAEDLRSAWKIDIEEGRSPRTWALAEILIRRGVAGILVPSFAPHAPSDSANLVLWRWGPDLPHKVAVYDPGGRLPKDQLSWRPPG